MSLIPSKHHLKDEQATLALASAFASELAQCPVTIVLQGTLGAGKSCFARQFIRHLTTKDQEVPSPTFNLLQTYDSSLGKIWHFDLYRLEHEDELIELGFEEAITNGITLIEWPDIAAHYLPDQTIWIQFRINDDDSRSVLITQDTLTTS